MKNVVIGGGGFIGSHLTELLLKNGQSTIVFDKPGALYLESLSNKGAKIALGDYLNASDLYKVLKDAEIVFHLVSTTVPKSSSEDHIFDIETNLIGTVRMLAIAKKAGVKKIIFPSSGGTVYGVPILTPIDENHPTNPICSYGVVKLAIEKYLGLYRSLYALDYCILRISNAYGERQPINKLQGIIPMLIVSGLLDREVHIWGDGKVIRDYIHVSDITSAIIKASKYLGESKIFNIGSGIGVSINELIGIIEIGLGKPLKIVYNHGQAYDVPTNILDISEAKKVLGWNPKIEINEGISRTIAFFKQQLFGIQ
jgi:UDP-glucose 4-epimerase